MEIRRETRNRSIARRLEIFFLTSNDRDCVVSLFENDPDRNVHATGAYRDSLLNQTGAYVLFMVGLIVLCDQLGAIIRFVVAGRIPQSEGREREYPMFAHAETLNGKGPRKVQMNRNSRLRVRLSEAIPCSLSLNRIDDQSEPEC
jgi:hypothetical protein